VVLDEPKANEAATAIDGVTIFIPEELKSIAQASTLDYIDEPLCKGFTIELTEESACS
jgi:Fe-S cluster assembly iron-binding protein IscA